MHLNVQVINLSLVTATTPFFDKCMNILGKDVERNVCFGAMLSITGSNKQVWFEKR